MTTNHDTPSIPQVSNTERKIGASGEGMRSRFPQMLLAGLACSAFALAGCSSTTDAEEDVTISPKPVASSPEPVAMQVSIRPVVADVPDPRPTEIASESPPPADVCAEPPLTLPLADDATVQHTGCVMIDDARGFALEDATWTTVTGGYVGTHTLTLHLGAEDAESLEALMESVDHPTDLAVVAGDQAAKISFYDPGDEYLDLPTGLESVFRG